MSVSISIPEGSQTVNEGSDFLQITLVTSTPVPMGELLTVDVEIAPGTATPIEDYIYTSPSALFIQETGVYLDRISIPGGGSLGSLILTIPQDDVVEGSEDFTIRITGVSPNGTIGEPSSITITIVEEDLVPTVFLVDLPAPVNEDEGFTKVTLITSEPVPSDENLTIFFEIVPGTAQPIEDYVYESVTATFDPETGIYTDTASLPSGFSASGIPVQIVRDGLVEGSETFTINITAVDSPTYQIGAKSSISVTIEDGLTADTTYIEDGNTLLNGLIGHVPGAYDIVVGVVSNIDRLLADGLGEVPFRFELNDELLFDPFQNSPLSELIDFKLVSKKIAVAETNLDTDAVGTVLGIHQYGHAIGLDSIQLVPVAPLELLL